MRPVEGDLSEDGRADRSRSPPGKQAKAISVPLDRHGPSPGESESISTAEDALTGERMRRRGLDRKPAPRASEEDADADFDLLDDTVGATADPTACRLSLRRFRSLTFESIVHFRILFTFTGVDASLGPVPEGPAILRAGKGPVRWPLRSASTAEAARSRGLSSAARWKESSGIPRGSVAGEASVGWRGQSRFAE